MNATTRPTPTSVRLDPELTQWLRERAKQNDRSMNAELIRILKEAKEVSEKQQTAA